MQSDVNYKNFFTSVVYMKVRGSFTNTYKITFLSNSFLIRKQRHETRYEEHLASELDRSCWIRILLEKVCCLHECRPVCRSSVFEHICLVLEKTGPTHVIGSKLFTTRQRESISRHFCRTCLLLIPAYLQRHSVSRSTEAATIDTS